MVGLVKSMSSKPVLQPLCVSVSASVVAIRLFPTPPLPLDTAIILRIGLSRSLIMLVRGSVTVFGFL